MSPPLVIEMEGVSFSYNGQPVLEDVNLSVARGDFVAVVGPNGGGKTTLVKLLLGLLRPKAGTVRVLGRSPRKARSRVGYMPQRSELDPKFPVNVLDVVLMGRLGPGRGLAYGARDRLEALQALGRVEMSHLAKRPFADLSGGQRQRVLIARALATGPELLLLDEPTSNVDPAGEEEIFGILRELSPEMTILTVSHDLGFVSPMVGHVICVHRKVFTHPTSDVTGEVISGLYGHPVRMVRHDHSGPPGGCACG